MRSVLPLALVLALVGYGCSDDSPSVTTPSSPTPTSPLTETFASGLVPMGTSARTVAAATAGAIELTLKSSGPPANVVVGVGIGIPTTVSAGCSLTTAVNTAPGTSPQLTVQVDAGTYCVKVFDVGNLTQQAFFELTIVRP